jgi:hypothetical protein
MATHDDYRATIKSLQDRREQLDYEINVLDQAIAILKGLESPQPTRTSLNVHAAVDHPRVGIYSRIGIRWACLWILSQAEKVGLSTATIADLLTKGGRTTKAGRFTSSVSAVLSSMKLKGEVEPIGNYWVLTDSGKAALEAIRPRLEVLAKEHLKYTQEQIDSMPLTKSRALNEAKDQDYLAACDYYYGGSSAASRPPF